MSDIAHTLGLDDSSYRQGLEASASAAVVAFDRVEARLAQSHARLPQILSTASTIADRHTQGTVRALGMYRSQATGTFRQVGGAIQSSTGTLSGMQAGLNRVKSLVFGVGGAFSAVAAGIAQVTLGVMQYRNGGEMLDKEMEKYKQIEISLDAQLTKHQEITRAIRDRYEEGLRSLDATPGSITDVLNLGYQKLADWMTGNDTKEAAKQRIEANRHQAELAAAAAEKNRQDLEADNLRKSLTRDVAGQAADVSEGPERAKFRVEGIEHEERLKRIRELTDLDKARLEELTALEDQRHWRAIQAISLEAGERQAREFEQRQREKKQAEERVAAAEDQNLRAIEDLRIGNLRAAGLDKEADTLETTYRFARLREEIDRSAAGEEAKRAALRELGQREAEALALAGMDKPTQLRARVAGTGLGATATRQVLGGAGGSRGERAAEKTAKTTEQIRDAMKEIVAELRNQVGAVFN
ncbi:MAG: hypothetical protein AB7O32_00240 [Vicinamibacterales bacterium]